MRELRHYTQPQNNRIVPANNGEESIGYELISSKNHVDWGGVIIQLGSKGLDKAGDIGVVVITECFKFLGLCFIGLCKLIVQLLQMAWTRWTYVPPHVSDSPGHSDNGGGHYDGHSEQTIIINNYHYH